MTESNLRSARVFSHDRFAGILSETDFGYAFLYDENYLNDPDTKSISLTLPKRADAYESHTLFPFFDGLIPEGWLLNRVIDNWKINPSDRFGLLLVSCQDCVGCVSIFEVKE